MKAPQVLTMQKLESGKVIVIGKNFARVIVPPTGISFDDRYNCWNVCVPSEGVEWTTTTFSSKKLGAMESFEAALKLREQLFDCHLTVRLLSRQCRDYDPVERNGRFAVRDPVEQNYVEFDTKLEAKAFNEYVVQKWINQYEITRDRMITIAEIDNV